MVGHRIVSIVLPDGYASPEEFAADCGVELVVRPKWYGAEWYNMVMANRQEPQDPYQPEPEQIAAVSRWLAHPATIRKVANLMPLAGGTRSAIECRVRDVALAMAALSCAEWTEP